MWNHRIIKKTLKGGAIQYGIHEVHYDENNKPTSCTKNPVTLLAFDEGGGETDALADLEDEIERYQKALERPVLNYEDF